MFKTRKVYAPLHVYDSAFYGCMQVIRTGLGSIPFVKDKDEKADEDEVEDIPTPAMPASNRPAVLPDGSYATQVMCKAGTLHHPWFLHVCTTALAYRRPENCPGWYR